MIGSDLYPSKWEGGLYLSNLKSNLYSKNPEKRPKILTEIFSYILGYKKNYIWTKNLNSIWKKIKMENWNEKLAKKDILLITHSCHLEQGYL